MSGEDLTQLLALQDLDTAITQLEHRRVALYERTGLAAVEAELAALSAEQTAAERQRAALQATQKDLEAQIAVVSERRAGIEQRMYAARGSSTRDLQAMDDEVRHLSERRAELEESEVVAMVEQDPIDATLTALAARRTPVEERAVAPEGRSGGGNTRRSSASWPRRWRPGRRRHRCRRRWPNGTRTCGPASRGSAWRG